MYISPTPGLFQIDVINDNEDLLPTGEDIDDIDDLPFPPKVSSSEFLIAPRKEE